MRISIGNDHAGTEYKNAIVKLLDSKGIEVINYGTDTNDSVDYPDFIHPVAQDVDNKKVTLGIIVCGSGNGANMTANKYQGVRSALCWTKEIAALYKGSDLYFNVLRASKVLVKCDAEGYFFVDQEVNLLAICHFWT